LQAFNCFGGFLFGFCFSIVEKLPIVKTGNLGNGGRGKGGIIIEALLF
jgi:hypothetical protein